jgi:hypothetical protein
MLYLFEDYSYVQKKINVIARHILKLGIHPTKAIYTSVGRPGLSDIIRNKF